MIAPPLGRWFLWVAAGVALLEDCKRTARVLAPRLCLTEQEIDETALGMAILRVGFVRIVGDGTPAGTSFVFGLPEKP